MTVPSESVHESNLSLSRREAMSRFAFFGSALAILQGRAFAQAGGAPGSYSNAAIALPPQTPSSSESEQDRAVKIARAMRAGPIEITREATVAEMDHRGNMTVLRKGSNGWVCIPGNEN